MSLQGIYDEINDDKSNSWAKKLGYRPIYSVSEVSRIVIVGQAPGKKAQESEIPWNDVSGDKLRSWLNVSKEQFYNTELFALLPMDFYYPGKGSHGDLPPRKDFAPKWHPRILSELKNAKLTLLIGNYSQKYYLGKQVKPNLTKTVKAYKEYLPKYLPLVHPSPLNFRWQTKNLWFETDVIPSLQQVVKAEAANLEISSE